MKFDEVLTLLGEFGPYQKRLYVILVLPALSCGIQMLLAVFIQGTPDHRCALPDWLNDTYVVQSRLHELYINSSIPYNDKDGKYAECIQYKHSEWPYIRNESDIPQNASTTICKRWVYDKSIFENSIVSKLNLVCSRKWYRADAQMIFMGGVLVGAFAFGAFSDMFGRRLTMYSSFLLHLLSTFAVAWSPNYVTFVILRFLTGASISGILVTAVVLSLEFVGPSKRLVVGIPIHLVFTLGELFLLLVAYFVRDWRYLSMFVSAPTALFLCYWWIIPESPRWLLSKNKEDEAEKIIRRVANYNKASLPKILFDDNSNSKQGGIVDIFRSPILLKRSAIIFYNWFIVSMGYYGLSLNVGNMGGNIYLNFLIVTVIEFPAVLICFLTLDRFGRRVINCAVMLLAGFACIGATFSSVYGGDDYHWVTVGLSMLGKLGVSMGFIVVYIFTAELYPTCVRNMGMGMASVWARVGGMTAPYVIEAGLMIRGPLGPGVPMLVFGLGTLVAGLLALMLPETRNQRLPQTIEDGKRFGRMNEQKNIKKQKIELRNMAYSNEVGTSDASHISERKQAP